MKINIASSHRFHLLDLARELTNQGHDVLFYSYLPPWRPLHFGLNKKANKSLFLLMLPFLALQKLSNQSYWSIKLSNVVLDNILTLTMRPCDVYIALGTVYSKSILSAKKKYEAITILEWGSKHINEQQRILSESNDIYRQPEWFIKRAIKGYKISDYISIPSEHVKKSFIDNGICHKKILKNPYGVDLKMFYPTELNNNNFDLIMVGGWSYRKGCDLIIEICKRRNFQFLHVGPIVDLEFPCLSNMVHVDAVNQNQLIDYYSKAKVFVLPSREEGLAMVQVQALACGLPIICTAHTGGHDLKELLEDKIWVIEMNSLTVSELERCIEQGLELAKKNSGKRSYSHECLENFSWNKYGERYSNNIYNISSNKSN